MHGPQNVRPANSPVQCHNQQTDHHLKYSQRDKLVNYDSLLFLTAVNRAQILYRPTSNKECNCNTL